MHQKYEDYSTEGLKKYGCVYLNCLSEKPWD